MFIELLKIADFMWKNFLHVWPYLLISVPAAVAINMSGIAKHISKVFNKKPLISILLATTVGAFSPFCSCGVIPVIASMLIAGVPLAPVMSFWLASPSMDPEIFFLSVSVLGWKLGVWRLASTFGMSLISGLITHYLVKKNWIKNDEIIKAYSFSAREKSKVSPILLFRKMKDKIFSGKKPLAFATGVINGFRNGYGLADNPSSSGRVAQILIPPKFYSENIPVEKIKIGCCDDIVLEMNKDELDECGCNNECSNKGELYSDCGCGEVNDKENGFRNKLMRETAKATRMVIKFMLLAFFLEALIIFYVPQNWISLLLGSNNYFSIVWAALIGVPVYTSSIPALALVGGLISKGMLPAAGLAFLISGPTTTIPAMAAVWNLASKKVFMLYVGFTLFFAVASGMIYYFVYLIL